MRNRAEMLMQICQNIICLPCCHYTRYAIAAMPRERRRQRCADIAATSALHLSFSFFAHDHAEALPRPPDTFAPLRLMMPPPLPSFAAAEPFR